MNKQHNELQEIAVRITENFSDIPNLTTQVTLEALENCSLIYKCEGYADFQLREEIIKIMDEKVV